MAHAAVEEHTRALLIVVLPVVQVKSKNRDGGNDWSFVRPDQLESQKEIPTDFKLTATS